MASLLGSVRSARPGTAARMVGIWSMVLRRSAMRERQMVGVRGSSGARFSVCESRWVGAMTTNPCEDQ
jgi:hypothetical protein